MAQVKKHSIHKAVNNAQIVLRNKGVYEVCVNAIRKYNEDELLTTDELNDLVEKIIDDTLYYAGR